MYTQAMAWGHVTSAAIEYRGEEREKGQGDFPRR